MNPLQLTDRSDSADRSVEIFRLSGHLSGNAQVIRQKLAKKVFLIPVPLTEGKAFDVPFVIGIVVSEITAVRGAAAVVDAPDFKGIAIADRADNRIVAPEVAGSRPVSHPTSLFRFLACPVSAEERVCQALSGRVQPGLLRR